jgi:hypothetical protein
MTTTNLNGSHATKRSVPSNVVSPLPSVSNKVDEGYDNPAMTTNLASNEPEYL